MPPKAAIPVKVTSPQPAAAEVDESQSDSERPLTPVQVDFSEHENTAFYISELGSLEQLNNERQSEVFTQIGHNCDGKKAIIQIWEPYAKSGAQFMK
jgi:hypothetical protein